jgi:hypothetical protein
MKSIKVIQLLADEAWLTNLDNTIEFDVAGLEGDHDILQYVKRSVLSKNIQMIMECTAESFPK